MSAARSTHLNTVFEVLPAEEYGAFSDYFYKPGLTLVGKAQNGAAIVFKTEGRNGKTSNVVGQFRTTSLEKDGLIATFSFTWSDNKYLFQAQLNQWSARQGELILVTDVYRIQRRSVKRLKVPNDYYAVVKFSQHNGRIIRVFGKLANISAQGLGILLPNENFPLKPGDSVRLVLTMSQRPPETIDMQVKHAKWVNIVGATPEESMTGYLVGGLFLPEHSVPSYKRMNAIVNDIVRDLFGTFQPSLKKKDKK